MRRSRRRKRRNQGLDAEVRVEYAEFIATHIQEQIYFADTKAAWTFSVLAVGTGALITKATQIDWAAVDAIRTISLISFSAFLIIAAFIQIVRVIYPRFVKGKKEEGLSYFGDIIEYESESYIKRGAKIKEKEIIDQLYQQAYNLAGIASGKFKKLMYGISLTSIALIATILVLVLV